MPLLSVSDLTVRFGGIVALDGVSFHIEAGRICGLIGPNGAGKTTLFNCLSRLYRFERGRIEFDGRSLAEVPRHRVAGLGVGRTFQNLALFRSMSVLDNVLVGSHATTRGGFLAAALRLPLVRREEARARRGAEELVELLDLGPVAHRRVSDLPFGTCKRVELARALVARPRLLLLDEPFSSLDVDLRERLAQEVRAILKDSGTTALLVTHDQFEAFAVGDRIGVMNRGRLEQWDDAYALYHRPLTRFVAGFIGHGVFTPARIVQCEHGQCVQTPLGELHEVDNCPMPDAYPAGECDVLLRADDILHDDASPVKALIERKSFRGSEFLYTLRLPSGERVLAHVPSHHDHQLGEWIGIRPAVDHVVTFSREAA